MPTQTSFLVFDCLLERNRIRDDLKSMEFLCRMWMEFLKF